LPKPLGVVNAWLMVDPREPKLADILAAMIDFRDAVAAQFARVDGRFANLESRMDERFDRVERRLARLDDRVSSVEERLSAVERRRKR